jgi:hypothetical protein
LSSLLGRQAIRRRTGPGSDLDSLTDRTREGLAENNQIKQQIMNAFIRPAALRLPSGDSSRPLIASPPPCFHPLLLLLLTMLAAAPDSADSFSLRAGAVSRLALVGGDA